VIGDNHTFIKISLTIMSLSISSKRTQNEGVASTGMGEDLSDYKYMLRQEGAYEESTHPDEYLGGSIAADRSLSPKRRGHKSMGSSIHSTKSVNSPHKWGAPEKPEQFRPDDWLGGSSHHSRRSWTPKSAPASKLGTVGTNSKAEQILALLPSINLDDVDKNDDMTARSIHSTASAAKSTATSLSTSSHHERRQALRDSGHKSQPKRCKAQRSRSVGSTRSASEKELDDTSPHEPTKVVRKKFKDQTKSFSGSSHGAPVKPVRLPSLDADIVAAQEELAKRQAQRELLNVSAGEESDTPKMKGKRPAANPKKFTSVPYGASAIQTETPVTPTETAPSPRETPPKVQSCAQRRAEVGNGVREEEKIDTNKFTSAFAMFEKSPSAQITPRKYQSAQPSSGMYKPRTEEEKQTAREKRSVHRQQQRGKANKARNATMSSPSTEDASTPESTPRRIQSLISPRNNVPRNFSVSREALLKSKQLSLNPSQDKPKTQDQYLQDIIAQLRKVQREKRDTSSSGMEADELMEMIRRLHHVDQGNNKRLSDILKRLEDNQGEHSLEELQSVLTNLEAMQDPNASHLTDEDQDWLESALRRLKKVQLTPREAEGVANTVRQLKHVDLSDNDGEAESDALIAKLNQTTLVYPTRKVNEVNQVLNGLRRIPLNDKERDDFAKKILGTAVQRPYVDELSDAILRLRKANLNQWEAKKAAGIAMDLRKTLKNLLAGVVEDEEDDDEDSVYSRLTRKELRQYVEKDKMDEIDIVMDKLKTCLSKVTEKEMNDFCKALEGVGKGDATREQARHQDYIDMLAEAIRNLKHAKLNRWEANEVHGIVANLRKTNFPEKDGDDNSKGADRRLAELCKVTSPEKMTVIEDIVKKVKKAVRFNMNEEIFEFFLDDVIAAGHGEPTQRQIEHLSAHSANDDDISYDSLKSDGGKSHDTVDDDDVQSVETMAISISSADISLSEEEVELTDDEEEKERKQASPKRFHHQFPTYTSHSCPASPASEDPANRRIVFTRKHHWQHKKHNNTVVGEKRWRLCENFATDEVIFSPLSREQHNRRKAIDGALKGALGSIYLGSSSRSLGTPPSNGLNNVQRLKPGSKIFDDEANSDLEEETHVFLVEKRLLENNINLNDLIKHAESSKKAVVLTPSPKRAARVLQMDSRPMSDLPF
jgi:hypothetical protein